MPPALPSNSGQPPQAQAALPPAEPVLQQRAAAALFISLLSLAGLMGLNNLQRGMYIALFALFAGAVALWLGVTAIVRARRARTAQPRGVVVATIVGVLGVGLSGLVLIAFTAMGSQLAQYGQCLHGANTIASQQSCYTQFQHTVHHEMSVLKATSRG